MSFYSFAPSAPNEYEVFFYSLLLCMNAPLVKELDEWVGEVLLPALVGPRAQGKETWVPQGPKQEEQRVGALRPDDLSKQALCLRDRVSHRNPISRKVLRLGD